MNGRRRRRTGFIPFLDGDRGRGLSQIFIVKRALDINKNTIKRIIILPRGLFVYVSIRSRIIIIIPPPHFSLCKKSNERESYSSESCRRKSRGKLIKGDLLINVRRPPSPTG